MLDPPQLHCDTLVPCLQIHANTTISLLQVQKTTQPHTNMREPDVQSLFDLINNTLSVPKRPRPICNARHRPSFIHRLAQRWTRARNGAPSFSVTGSQGILLISRSSYLVRGRGGTSETTRWDHRGRSIPYTPIIPCHGR